MTTDIRLGLPTVIMIVAVVAAGAFAAGSAMPTASAPPPAPPATAMEVAPAEDQDPLPPGHPSTASDLGGMDLPPGHPPVDSMQGQTGPAEELPAAQNPSTSLAWTAPARWRLAPNPSSMRIATYRVPRAAGDSADAELSITQAGGSADANITRWIGQFDAAGQKSAKRSTRRVGPLDVTIVEVQGTYSGAMAGDGTPRSGWALLAAIVSTPDMPHFFKLTGPVKTVLAARGEFDAMIGSLVPREAPTEAP